MKALAKPEAPRPGSRLDVVKRLEEMRARGAQIGVGSGTAEEVAKVDTAFRALFPPEPTFVEEWYVPAQSWREWALVTANHGLFYHHVFFKKIAQAHWAELHVGTLVGSILGTGDW
jgi:hypothetical protein